MSFAFLRTVQEIADKTIHRRTVKAILQSLIASIEHYCHAMSTVEIHIHSVPNIASCQNEND